MQVGILGSGTVGRALADKVDSLGHEVRVGTRDVAALMARHAPGPMGQVPFAQWRKEHPGVKLATFRDTAANSEILFNATNGAGCLAALRSAGEDHLNGKILIDVANPLDFSQGFPPTLSVANIDSLGEQIQRSFPEVRVVKTLNTVNAAIMVDPLALADGEHHIFISGNDPTAKTEVLAILNDWFGWRHVIDLGDISTARGTEMYLALWVRLLRAVGHRPFNIRVISE